MASLPNEPPDTPTNLGTGKSPYAFMVEAFGVQARLIEQRRAFLGSAHASERNAFASGEGYAASDVDAYFEALAGERVGVPPSAKSWRR